MSTTSQGRSDHETLFDFESIATGIRAMGFEPRRADRLALYMTLRLKQDGKVIVQQHKGVGSRR